MQRKGREFCDEIWETIDVILDELDDERDTYDRHGDHIVNSLPEPIKTKIKGLVSGVVFIDASDKIVEYLRRKGVWFDTTV